MQNQPNNLKAVVDISKLSENDRITLTGQTAMSTPNGTWCLTDDQPGKIERYRDKMKKQFPFLELGEIKRGFPGLGCGGFTCKPPKTNS